MVPQHLTCCVLVPVFAELIVLADGDNPATLRDAIAHLGKAIAKSDAMCRRDSPSFDAWIVNTAIVSFREKAGGRYAADSPLRLPDWG